MSKLEPKILGAVLISTIFVFGIYGCSGVQGVRGYNCSELAETYFRKSTNAMIEDFNNNDIEKQYAIFICGNQYVHPPAIYLAEPFASEGEQVVDFLKARMTETDDDLTIRDIVLVFSEMKRLKTYDVAGDTDLMRIIEEKVGNMKDPDWKQVAAQEIKKIK